MIWPVHREWENDIPEVFTHRSRNPLIRLLTPLCLLLPLQADGGFSLMLHVGKYPRWALFLSTPVCEEGGRVYECVWVCVCVCGSGGRVAAQVSRKWLLTEAWPWGRRPFNQPAAHCEGPIIALIDWILLSAQIMDDARTVASCLAS